MSVDENLEQNIPEQLNFYLNLSTTKISRRILIRERSDTENLPKENTRAAINTDPSIILLPCLLLLMGWIVIIHRRYLAEEAKQLKELDDYPCKNCRFFSNNRHLKCAVNPSNVLTKSALDCRDYDPLHDSKKVNLRKDRK
ncbi:hypothetical protein H6G41_30640 [Tolypothrix sp. FACHB-123]|uniref:hypothetical protein n=1 Tax=Tolypothrix sp. FACHB-123 TaxID=2692868 RepID=UPI0016896BCA|nr:hypothetical protein [Tolypothrix sp. FACHB-123]MBD2358906.1 hypothetical protein [Tolypothrix sp. FACHB-123]